MEKENQSSLRASPPFPGLVSYQGAWGTLVEVAGRVPWTQASATDFKAVAQRLGLLPKELCCLAPGLLSGRLCHYFFSWTVSAGPLKGSMPNPSHAQVVQIGLHHQQEQPVLAIMGSGWDWSVPINMQPIMLELDVPIHSELAGPKYQTTAKAQSALDNLGLSIMGFMAPIHQQVASHSLASSHVC